MLNTNTNKLHSLYLYELLGGDTGSGLQENFYKLMITFIEKPLTEHVLHVYVKYMNLYMSAKVVRVLVFCNS